MKHVLTLLLAFASIGILPAQNLASRLPEGRFVVVEEFTGVRCQFCPDGHTILKNIINQYPTEVTGIGYHPTTSGLTSPVSSTDPDLRRAWPNDLYASSFALGNAPMPSAFINRRVFGNTRWQSRGVWSNYARNTRAQLSTVNVGMKAEYDTAFNLIIVDVEVYYTANTNDHTLSILLTEDSVVATQIVSGSPTNSNYIHNHVFRESITMNTWGDSIHTAPQRGNSYTKQFYFDNNLTRYNWKNLNVVAILRDVTNEEITSGTEVHHIGPLNVSTGIEKLDFSQDIEMFPNPTEGTSTVQFTTTESTAITAKVFTVMGQEVDFVDFGTRSAGTQKLSLDVSELPAGVYMVELTAGNAKGVKRLIKQ